MALLALAYPELAPGDRGWIESIRAEHHPRHASGAAYFTLVYPVRDLDADAFVADVSRQAAGCARIPFVLRWALPFKDVTGEGTDVFLVPEEGFSARARLHGHPLVIPGRATALDLVVDERAARTIARLPLG